MTESKAGKILRYINSDVSHEFDITFMVPCLNEEGNIGPTLCNINAALQKLPLKWEVLVFDDASTDGTAEEVRDIMKKFPDMNVRLILNKKGRGLARNYVDGAYIGRGKHYMLVNGDNAEPVETIRAIVELTGQADIIIPVFRDKDRRTFKRRYISKTFTAIVNFITGYNIDYYNGPAIHRRYNVMRWHADTDGFAYQAEIITRLLQEGATYREVVVENSDRQFGSSSALNLKNLLAISHSLFQIGMRRLRHILYYSQKSPTHEARVITSRSS